MKKYVIAALAFSVLAAAVTAGWYVFEAHRDKQMRAEAKSECVRTVAPLRDHLNEMDARVAIGMNQAEMHDLVSDAAVKHGKIDAAELATINPGCLNAAVHFEKAFNDYIDADSVWSECIEDYECDLEDGTEADMQAKWQHASDEITKGNTALRRFKYHEPAK